VHVVISGASGLIGTALTRSLTGDGHRVVRLVRRPPRTPDEVGWDPASGRVDAAALDGADAVVNLSGAGVGDRRWTSSYRREIRDSRVFATRTLAAAVARHGGRVALVNASAVGWYGDDRGEEILTERSVRGEGFLSDVVDAWESATEPAVAAGAPVALVRTGLVQSRRGGALARMLPVLRLGLGGRLGSGRQWWPIISLRDVTRGYRFLLDASRAPAGGGLGGPYNLTAQPVRNAELTAALGAALHRPTVLPVPGIALRIGLGGFAGGVVGSLRVVPDRLREAGFTLQDPDPEAIVRSALAD
jgi:uncharacterized protein (TIGR01777 family)